MAAPPSFDIAVIGGGPGGLAAAAALLRAAPSLHVGVFERSALRRRGAHVFLSPDGIGALRAIRPELAERVLDLRSEHPPVARCDLQGRPMGQPLAPGLRAVRQAGARVLWSEVQGLLAATLPPGVLHPDAAFSHYEEAGDCVEAHFHGTRTPVRARLLVGADGNRSVVRQQCVGDGPPAYAGQAVWRGLLDCPGWWEYPNGAISLTGSGGYTFRAIGKRSRGGLLVWIAAAPWPQERLGELASVAYIAEQPEHSEAVKRRVLGTFRAAGCAPEIARVLEATDAAAITEHGQFYRPPEQVAPEHWGRGRVTLLGDAAHLATPFLSLGTTEALRDAVELARAVQQQGPTPAALRAYERLRHSQVAPRHALSLDLYHSFTAGAAGVGEREAAALMELHKTVAPVPPLVAC